MLHEHRNTTKQYHVSRKSKHYQTVSCCTNIETQPNDILLHEHQHITKQYHVTQKSKHYQTVSCYTKFKTPLNSFMFHESQKHVTPIVCQFSTSHIMLVHTMLVDTILVHTMLVHTMLVSFPHHTHCQMFVMKH